MKQLCFSDFQKQASVWQDWSTGLTILAAYEILIFELWCSQRVCIALHVCVMLQVSKMLLIFPLFCTSAIIIILYCL